MEYVLIFGSNPKLSLAESEAVFKVTKLGVNALSVFSDLPPESTIDSLGGTIKIGKLLSEIKGTDTKTLISQIKEQLLNNISTQKKGVFGISDYSHKFKENNLYTITKEIKKILPGWRYISNFPSLTTVQVEKNHLIEKGFELLIVELDGALFAATTLAVQDFENYSDRDYGRPCRPLKMGMMPPKLAQMLINITVRKFSSKPLSAPLILDPFCGSGTVLSEALLMNFKVIGSDLSADMVACARENLKYFRDRYHITSLKHPEELVLKADAKGLPFGDESIDFIVTEGTLGPMFTKLPVKTAVDDFMRHYLKIMTEFLREARRVLKPGARLGLTLPVIMDKAPRLVDTALNMGYSVVVDNLVYKRPEQFTGREILVLEKH